MKKALILLLSLLLYRTSSPLTTTQNTSPPPIHITINRVIDGDTLEVTLPDGTVEKVRLLCVNTEESVHPDKKRNTDFGKQTSAHARELLRHNSGALPGFLEFEAGRRRDKYGRLLCYVFPTIISNQDSPSPQNPPPSAHRSGPGGINLNLYLVRQGYSPYYTPYGRSRKYHDEFKKAERHARDNKLGIWATQEGSQRYLRLKSGWGEKAAYVNLPTPDG